MDVWKLLFWWGNNFKQNVKMFLFIYLAAPGLHCGIKDLLVVECALLSCGTRDLVPSLTRDGWMPKRNNMNPTGKPKSGPSALGARSLSQWTTGEVPTDVFYIGNSSSIEFSNRKAFLWVSLLKKSTFFFLSQLISIGELLWVDITLLLFTMI